MRSIPSFVTEKNVFAKEKGKTFGLIFPAYYNIAMNGMTVITLGNIVNSQPGWRFERIFLPWNPFVEPRSMEHTLTLSEMDVLGFTSQFELDYLIVGWMLRKAGIPIDNMMRKRKKGKYPPVFVGGPCAGANPFPLMDLVDGFFLGDAECSLPQFLKMLNNEGIAKFWSNPSDFNKIRGFWTPHALEANGIPYSSLFREKTFEEVAGSWYDRFDFTNLDEIGYPIRQIVSTLPDYHPYAPIKGQSFQLEIGRGCSHACRFCMIGSGMFSPARFRSLSRLLEIVDEGVTATDVLKVGIFGVNLSDFPHLTDLCWSLVNQGLKLSIATLRPDKVTSDLIEAISKGGQNRLTIAPETGTDQLRRKLCKNITNERILDTTHIIFENGINALKNFFLVGLPTETEGDRLGIIKLIQTQRKLAQQSGVKDFTIQADLNPMVPKWQTPLKNWVYNYLPSNRTEFKERIEMLDSALCKIPHIKTKSISLKKFLMQTWLTHLENPINDIIELIPVEKHTQVTVNTFQFLSHFIKKFDTILYEIWNNFEENNWQIIHKVHATCRSDEDFSRKYQKMNLKKKSKK